MSEVSKTKPLLFELNEEMLSMISQEFSPEEIAAKFCQAVDGYKDEAKIKETGREIFFEYGRSLMRRTLQLGEEYPDRTYEVLREAVDRTGELTFPLIPQRFIEIAYLSIQDIVLLPVIENNERRFIFQVEKCRIYEQVKRKCGQQIASALTCRHGCLEAIRTAFDGFGLDIDEIKVDMNASTENDGYCEFIVRRGSGEFEF
jgi:hypothetical protein